MDPAKVLAEDPPRSAIFVVWGTPVQEGNIAFSKQGRGYHREGASLKAWRRDIQIAAKAAYAGKPWDGPVRLELFFEYKPAHKALGGTHRTLQPDADKLARAVLDALTGILFKNDAQVADLLVTKTHGEWFSKSEGGPGESRLVVNAWSITE